MSPRRVGLRAVMIVAVASACAGIAGCVLPGDVAIRRASREYSCPDEKIGVIQRSDISPDVYDLYACGHRARYSCFDADPQEGSCVAEDCVHCVREPDPERWDPDPKEVAKLPAPHDPVEVQRLRSTPGEARRVCRDQTDFSANRDCVLR